MNPTPPESILHTKLMPPRLHSTLVRREALFARLDQGLAKKVTLVSAPTGFGKTTVVSAWLSEHDVPAAWVTLDDNDNDPVRFWTYVLMALRGIDLAVGRTALSALAASPPPSSFQPILTTLINDLSQLEQASLLILEDYHAITSGEIHTALAYLLQHLPEKLHLVLVSRAEPELPLGILRARDELVEIDAQDLRFSQAETRAFLSEALREALPAGAVEKLQAQTEGWAAGLRLATLALQNKGGQEAERVIASFSGSHRYVADYLTNEVFAGQPEQVQAFLLATCFLARLCGELCEAVAGLPKGQGQAMLEKLERQNLFVVQLAESGERSWYRYNPLFAESIQVLARRRLGESGLHAIFAQASGWYEYQQMFDEAIESALAARDFDRAIALVDRFVEIYNLGEMRTLGRWLERIPSDLAQQHPAICMTYAQVMLFSLDRYAPATAARIEPYLQAAERVWRAQGQDEKVGTVLALRGMMLIWQGQFQQALDCVHLSLDMMAEDEAFWRGISLLNAAAGDMNVGRMSSAQSMILEARAYLGASQNIYGLMAATSTLSELLFFQGDLEQSAQLARQLMEEAIGDESMLDDQAEARRILANVAYEQNDLENAERFAGEGLELARQRGNELLEAQLQGRLSAIHAARGEHARAHNELLALAARLQSRLAQREAQDGLAWLAVHAGDKPDLSGWLATIANEHENLLYQQRERQTFIQALLHIAAGGPEQALALLEPLPAEGIRSRAQVLCLRALAQRAAGDLDAARKSLKAALEIGHEKGFRRLFVDEGEPLALLLRDLGPALPERALSLYAGTLLHLFPADAGAPRTGLAAFTGIVEPLSSQELRVLRLLVAGMSNGEIAAELVVSTNTIKTHVKSIYRKLDINSRDEARLVARELKLL